MDDDLQHRRHRLTDDIRRLSAAHDGTDDINLRMKLRPLIAAKEAELRQIETKIAGQEGKR
jgi:hypothetical protein